MPTLPDVKGKVVLDDSQLAKAGATATKTGDQIKKGMQTGTAHTLRFEQSLSTLMSHLGGMPPIASQGARSLESMASTGVTGMGLIAGGALVAAGAVAEIVHASMDAYQRIGSEVEDFRRVSGATAEESSKLVYVFNAVGVSGDSAATGIFRLSKSIETTPKKLTDLGIVIDRTASGNVNLSKTLMNVADAYNATEDPAKRNLILFDAFGRSGRDMIPVLEQGSAAIARMEGSASLLFSQADLDRLKEAKIHTQEVKSAWDEWWAATIGGPATQAQNAIAESLLAQQYAQKKYNDALADGTVKHELAGPALGKLLNKYEDEYYKLQGVREKTDAATQATKDLTAANEKEAAAEDKLISEQEARINSSYAMKLADLAVAENAVHLREAQDKVALATDRVKVAQQKAQDVAKQYGKNTGEYQKALDDLAKANDDLTLAQDDVTRTTISNEKNILAAAAAARKLQEDTDLAATGQKDVKKETQAYVDKLYEEAQALDKNSPLRKNIEGLIYDLGQIPTQVKTTFIMETEDRRAAQTAAKEARAAHQGYAGGGRPAVGIPAWIGENGPEIWTPDEPGTITPAGGIPPAPAPSGGDHLSVIVNAETNADAHDIAQDAAWELRRLRRNF